MSVTKSKSRRQSMLLVAIFLCIEFVDEVVDGLSGAAWPLIRDDLSLSYTEIGLLFSIPSIVACVLEPPIGLLGDAWRRFVLIALGGLAFATALVMFAGATDFASLLIAMALFYPASGTFVSLSQSSLIDTMPQERERSMVVWTVAGTLGVAVGPIVLMGVLALGGSWRDVYVGVAVVALTLTAALWLVRPRVSPHEAVERPPLRAVARDAWDAVRRPGVLRWLGLLAAVDLLLEVFAGFVALYFVDVVGGSAAVGAIAVTIWTVAALAGESALVLVLTRVDGLRLVRRSAVLVAILFPAFLLVDNTMAKLGLLGMLGLCSAGWYSILVAQYYGQMPDRTGTAMAVSAAIIPLQALAPVAVGLLAEHFGLQTALWVVLLAPFVLMRWARPTVGHPDASTG